MTMKPASFNTNLNFDDQRVVISVILETAFSKEIRILFNKGQIIKDHKAPYPISVHVLEGEIDFGADSKNVILAKGDIVTLNGNMTHNLYANEQSVVRLTLSKLDAVKRVQDVIKD